MNNCLHTALACAALVLAGCAAAPVHSPSPATGRTFSSPEQAITYHVFMGELASQRGDSETATNQYAEAALSSTDPLLAQHAMLLAYKSGNDSLALKLTHHWLQLEPGDNAARHFEAVLNTRLGNVDAAVSEFEKLLADTPGENLPLIGSLLAEETDAKYGLAVMQKLVASQPGSAQAHLALAELAMQYKNPQLAIEEARRASSLEPDQDQAVILEARAMLADGDSNSALELLKKHALAKPSNTRLHLAYGAVLVQVGQMAAARAEFSSVLKQHPGDADALYSLGLLALHDTQLQQAEEYFTRLLHTGQRDNAARYFLGNTSELAKRYPEALRWYRQVDGGNNWLAAQIGVARVLINQQKPEAARGYMDNAVSMDPDDGEKLRLTEAQLFSDSGDNKTALQVLNQGVGENPGSSALLYERALLLEQSGDTAAAENDLRAILSRDPDDADALNALGYILTEHTTQYREARGYITKALQLKPGDPAIIDSMGWVEYRLGNYQQALSYLRKSYARLADPEVAAHLTEVLWVNGDRQEAHRVWSDALKRNPGDASLLKVGRQLFP